MSIKSIFRSFLPTRARSAARDFLWRLLGIKWTMRSGLPVELHGLSDWIVYSDIFVNGEYDEAIEHAYSTLPAGEQARILDLGANTGFFAMRCLDLAKRRGIGWDRLDLTLIEGSAAVFEGLMARVGKWGEAGRVLHLKHGLAGQLGGAGTMESADLNCMNSVVTDEQSGGSRFRIDYLDLRPYFREHGNVQLLKCDIEGSELMFLENYAPQLSSVASIVIELHHDKCDTRRCMQILQEAGFSNRRMLREAPTFAVAFAWR